MPKLHWPVKGRLTQAWMMRPEVYARFGQIGHNGIDFSATVGTKVMAMADGVVAHIDQDPPGYGMYLRIWHPRWGMHSFMAHLSKVLVQVNQPVMGGDIVAETGNSGFSSGPHIHVEVRAGSGLHSYDTVQNGFSKGRIDPLSVLIASDKWCEEKPEG